jgi:hypothetical protein
LILSGAASSTCCDFAADYEQLRSDVLEGASTGRHFGLVILLREGVAAWMAHASARPATITGGTPKDRSMASALSRTDPHVLGKSGPAARRRGVQRRGRG